MGNAALGENLSKQPGKLYPLGVGATTTNRQRLTFQSFKGFDFDAEFGNGPGCSGLIEDLLLRRFHLVVGRFVQVFHVFAVQRRQ